MGWGVYGLYGWGIYGKVSYLGDMLEKQGSTLSLNKA